MTINPIKHTHGRGNYQHIGHDSIVGYGSLHGKKVGLITGCCKLLFFFLFNFITLLNDGWCVCVRLWIFLFYVLVMSFILNLVPKIMHILGCFKLLFLLHLFMNSNINTRRLEWFIYGWCFAWDLNQNQDWIIIVYWCYFPSRFFKAPCYGLFMDFSYHGLVLPVSSIWIYWWCYNTSGTFL